MAEPHYVEETQILRRAARDPQCRFQWSGHALERMSNRQINAEDVSHALMNGQVILEEVKQDLLWRVKGRDIDMDPLEVLVALQEDSTTIKVITTF
jgi:hypothetical protein